MKTLIIIPAYNEELSIENTINKIFTDNKINSIEIKIIKILFLL